MSPKGIELQNTQPLSSTLENPWTWRPNKRKHEEDDEYGDYSIPQDFENETSLSCHISPACGNLLPFKSYAAFEDHYYCNHLFTCSQCKRVLPTAHLLHLHLLEIHDRFFAVLARKHASYECFVENCKFKFANEQDRKQHLIKVHLYPRKFDFSVIFGKNNYEFKRKSKDSPLQRNKQNSLDDMDIDQLTQSFAKIMIPRSIQFRHKSNRVSSFKELAREKSKG
jgi:hypothetical protein